ncbi:MAG TPA: biopolymer transporter ExbD [Acidobacteriaceae bacterium]|nr:biopolymer transporter ExbD [Acidobacteriaceae bacterium]
MAITGTDPKQGITGINVTPLIDVLLVLLIIFMVIVPVTSRGLTSNIPQSSKNSQPDPESTVVVQIVAGPRGELTYLLNQTPLPESEIAAKLAGIFASRQQKTIFVKADPSIEYARIAEVIDTGHQAGVDNIGLVTPRIQNGQ